MQKILLLGGTAQGREIADSFALQGRSAIYSLAGRTQAPKSVELETRHGGFGAVAGLSQFICKEKISAVVDATHPFAAQMSKNAIEACNQLQLPYVYFERAQWCQQNGDKWHVVPDLQSAVTFINEWRANRFFLATGLQSLEYFQALKHHYFLARTVDPYSDEQGRFEHFEFITQRGPFKLNDELQLFKSHKIGAVISKNSGGLGVYGKIAAARALNLPVIMIARPHLPVCERVHTLDALNEWLDHLEPRGE